MADRYLIPSSITWRAVHAEMQGFSHPHFQALFLYFDQPSTNFTGDVVYPSYDGAHKGLLRGYECSVLGYNKVTPLYREGEASYLYIRDSESNAYICVYPYVDEPYTFDLRWCYNNTSTSNFGISYRGANFYYAGILVVAVFSDGAAYIRGCEITINPDSPPTWCTLQEPTTTTFGYLLVNVEEESGFARLPMVTGFYIGNENNKAMGDILLKNAYIISTDPYDNFPEPVDTGGDGEPGLPGDDIDIPATPAISASDSGFITLYAPTLAQIKALAQYMWSGLFDIDSFKKIFADPMDCILGLSIVPVQVPRGSIVPIVIGNVSTGVNVSTVAANYVELDCGSLTIPHEFKSYLDYAPFTTVDIFLPYIGVRHLDTDNIMPQGGEANKTIQVVYKVDLFSGGCVAFIKCGNSVMYSFAGQCSTQVPVTSQSWTDFYKTMVNIAASAIGAVAAGGGAGSSVTNIGAMGESMHSRTSLTQSSSHSSSLSASSVADAVFARKPQIDRSGVVSSAIGFLGIQKPYLIIRRPVACIPRYQNNFLGYPSFRYHKVGDLSGYVEMEEIHLEHIPATENEVEEIYSLLKSGVII